MEILKGVRATALIHKNNLGTKLILKGDEYLGTEFFTLRSDLVPKGYQTALNKIDEIKCIDTGFFNNYMDWSNYDSTDDDIEYRIGEYGQEAGFIMFQSKDNKVWLNYKYYSYFKNLGFQFRFTISTSPAGMFKDGEFAGLLFPVRILT